MPNRLHDQIALMIHGIIIVPFVLVVTLYLCNWRIEDHYREANRKALGQPVSVVLLGDSVTAGWSYPRPKHLFLVHPDILNRGISGDHVEVMILRMFNDVFHLHPKTVVFLGGINNLKSKAIPNPLRFLATIEVEIGIRIVSALTELHHERLFLCSLTPVDEYRARSTLGIGPDELKTEQILTVNTWIEQYAQENGVVYVDYYAAMTDGKGQMRPELSDDGLHPNDAGYAVMELVLMHALDCSCSDTPTR